jgi:hypothetical protein
MSGNIQPIITYTVNKNILENMFNNLTKPPTDKLGSCFYERNFGIYFLDKNITCAKQTYICQSNSNEVETQYIYYYLVDKKYKLEKGYTGSCHKNLSSDYLENFKINIPRNKSLIQKLDPTFQQIEQLQIEVKNADILYNKLIKELADEAIPPSKQTQKPKMKTIEEEIMDTSDISSIDIEKETKKSIKKIKTKMKTIEEEIMDTSDISSIDNEKETKKSIKKIKIKKVSPDSSSDEIKNKIKNKIKN